ncbi:MAG: hypothetical protein L6Q65_11640, partial [Zoogloea sp.]|nr:hypothetical protein [Zoogloea sp.]
MEAAGFKLRVEGAPMIMSILRRLPCGAALLLAAVHSAGAAEPPRGPAAEAAVNPAPRRIASVHAGVFG